MDATVLVDGKKIAFVVGTDHVQSVFAGDKGELVVVYPDQIVKYFGCPFVSTVGRKDKDIKA